MEILIFKFLSMPLLICLVSWTQKRFSHHAGGMIGGLPLTVVPILVFLAIEQGADFA